MAPYSQSRTEPGEIQAVKDLDTRRIEELQGVLLAGQLLARQNAIQSDVSPKVFEKLEQSGLLEGLRYTYDSKDHILAINSDMASALHEFLKWWFYHIVFVSMLGIGFVSPDLFDESEHPASLYHEDGYSFKHFVGKLVRSEMIPDMAIINTSMRHFHASKQLLPVAVSEVAVSQDYFGIAGATEKVKKWLYGSPLTRIVIIVKVWEGDKLLRDSEGLGPDDSYILNPQNQSQRTTVDSQPTSSKTSSDTIKAASTVLSPTEDTVHAFRATAAAKELYDQRESVSHDNNIPLSLPNITIRAEVWRRTQPTDCEDASTFIALRDDVKYVMIKGQRIPDVEASIRLWKSDLIDVDSENDTSISVGWDYLFSKRGLIKACEQDGLRTESVAAEKKRKRAISPEPKAVFFGANMAKRRKDTQAAS